MFNFHRERPLSGYVRLVDHVSPNIALLKDGSAFAMFELDGLPAQTLDMDALVRRRSNWNHVLCGLASTDGLVLHNWVCRGFATEQSYPQGVFRSQYAAAADGRYRARLLDRFLFLNRTYVGVMLRPPRMAGEWIGDQVEKHQQGRDIANEAPIERIRRLRSLCDSLAEDLAPYHPRLLGYRTDNRGIVFTEIGEALVFAMTGVWRSVGLQAGRRFGELFSERIITGPEAIEIRGPGQSSWAACFGSKHMPHACPPGAWDGFQSASYRSTIAQTWRPLQTQQALALMGRKQNRMVGAGDRAHSQIQALTLAMDEVQSGRMAMGDHSGVVTVFVDDLADMRTVATKAWHTLQDAGSQVAREDSALEAAYMTMLPGNGRFRPRPGVISSWNYASLASMHAYPSGTAKGYWGDPHAIFRTVAGTAFRYHLHVNQSANIFVYGSTRSGKTSWLAWLLIQAQRTGVQCVVWDKDRGLEIACRALGGSYSAIRHPTHIAPLKALTDSPEDVHHIARLTRGVIFESDPTYKFTAEEDRRLFIGIRAVMALPPEDRWFADVRSFLGVARDGAGAKLEKWCAGYNGELAWVLDNPRDQIDLTANVIGFDVTEFLKDSIVSGPIMSHLLYRTGKLADGRRLLYIVDEGWRVVDIPAFADDAMDGFKTGGKKNFGVVFATQSIADALKSRIGHTIREQVKTIVGFAVERPDRADFKMLKYSDRECEIVEELQPGTGTFLLSQGNRSTVLTLPLDKMKDDIAVLSGNEISVQTLDDVRAELGDAAPPERLIEEFHRQRERV